MQQDPFLLKVDRSIMANALMQKDLLYLVALSGGADSVALLLSLKRLGFNVEAVHCNFHLRGEESDRDEKYCRNLCNNEGVRLHVVHFDTISYASLHKQSIEMAARNLRYSYFRQLASDIGAAGICVGHHIEDSVETLLINLIRGTGINGLTGIGMRNGIILRPLLEVTRQEIEEFLKKQGVSYVTDSTNLVDDVTRNRIRLNIMPLIRDINPSADLDIAKTARRIEEANNVFQAAIGDACTNVVCELPLGGLSIDVQKLLQQISPQYTLFTILSKFSFSPSMIDNIFGELTKLKNGSMFSSKTHDLLFDRGKLLIQPISADCKQEMKIPETGSYIFNDHLKLRFQLMEKSDEFKLSREKSVATLDADLVSFPLVVRKCKAGDWFIPFGMRGKKLLSDYMTDRKLSLFDKQRQLVLADTSGNIVWLVGERPDGRYAISERTKIILTIKATTNI